MSGNLTWSVVPAGPSIVSGGNSAQVTWSSPGTYTLSATDGNLSESFTVNVYAVPVPVIQYTTNPCNAENSDGGSTGSFKCDSFCVGEIVTYTVPNTPGNTYVWSFFPATGGTIISGQGTDSVVVIWSPSSLHPLDTEQSNQFADTARLLL